MSRSTADRILYALKSRGPQTAATLGAALSITPAGVGQWLARLADDGLVVAEDRRHGRGRPRRHWRLTEAGHGRFPDRHSDLTVEMLEATRAVFGAEGLDRLIAHRESGTRSTYAKALEGRGTLAERLAALAALRSAEGYMARIEPADAGGFVLIEDHCPICAAAAVCQGLCRSELAVFRTVLGPDVEVERVEHVLAGGRRCAYAIRPARRDG